MRIFPILILSAVLTFGNQIAVGQAISKDVELVSDSITIRGTLVLPEGEALFPVALLISGSGPTDRNGNNPSMENNSLKMLSDSLAANGIASLRYDKRGVAASADSSINESNLRFDDYIHDAQKWVNYLKSLGEFDQITIIGHSEGSLIGIIASENGQVDKFVSLAGAGKPAGQIILEQINAQSPFLGAFTSVILDSISAGQIVTQVPPALESFFRPSVQPYLHSWMNYNPQTEIAKLKIPVLIVQGTTDIQVSVGDAELLKKADPEAQLVLIPGMNHVLKNAPEDRQANIATYSNPNLPINGTLVKTIVAFIHHN